MTDNTKLRKLAKAANPGPWTVHKGGYVNPSWTDETFCGFGKQVSQCWRIFAGPGEISTDAYVYDKVNAAYIAAADPTTILALFDQLKAANERIAALETELSTD